MDLANGEIDVLFKLYPWEWMFQEEFGATVIGSRAQFIEPIWKSLLSTKALLPHLWRKHRGHTNLLPSYFAGAEGDDLGDSYVEKPIHSARARIFASFARAGRLRPQMVPMTGRSCVRRSSTSGFRRRPRRDRRLDGREPACGHADREDRNPITGNLARFVPHFIEA